MPCRKLSVRGRWLLAIVNVRNCHLSLFSESNYNQEHCLYFVLIQKIDSQEGVSSISYTELGDINVSLQSATLS